MPKSAVQFFNDSIFWFFQVRERREKISCLTYKSQNKKERTQSFKTFDRYVHWSISKYCSLNILRKRFLIRNGSFKTKCNNDRVHNIIKQKWKGKDFAWPCVLGWTNLMWYYAICSKHCLNVSWISLGRSVNDNNATFRTCSFSYKVLMTCYPNMSQSLSKLWFSIRSYIEHRRLHFLEFLVMESGPCEEVSHNLK